MLYKINFKTALISNLVGYQMRFFRELYIVAAVKNTK